MTTPTRARPRPGRSSPRASQTTLALLIAALSISPASADNLRLAYQLLRVTGVAEEFERAADAQTADIVRTYTLIVKGETDRDLPESIKQQIASCYRRVYAWENFESGFAAIFAENMSQADLRILIDFFNDLSVPPPQIPTFKKLITRADDIEQHALNYMFDNTEGCEKQNVDMIRTYLASQG